MHLAGLRADRACSVATATLHAACCTMLCCAVRRCNQQTPARRYASVIELFPYKVNRPLFANIIDKVPSHSNANAQACNVHHATYKCFFPVRAELSIDSQVMVASEEFHSESNQTYKVRYYQWQNRHFHPPPPALQTTRSTPTVPQHTSESGSHSLQAVSVPPRPPTLQGGPGFVRLWSADLSGTVSHTRVRARACACACVRE